MTPWRHHDDQLLAMVTERASGATLDDLAQRFDRHRSAICNQTSKILKADLNESGEDPKIVTAAYWRRNKKTKQEKS